ncbi:MAG: MoaD/ThiS family protein [Promethearchaeota archaeon]
MLTKNFNEVLKFDKELTLIQLIKHLQEKYGEEFRELVWDKRKEGELHKMLSIIINGRSFRYEGFLETVIKEGDDISFIYIFFGG